jgi:hypothetical protein
LFYSFKSLHRHFGARVSASPESTTTIARMNSGQFERGT